MMISSDSAAVLVDLVKNKLSVMNVDDRDDLREAIALQRALAELEGAGALAAGGYRNFTGLDVPRRGRRKKIGDIIGDRV